MTTAPQPATIQQKLRSVNRQLRQAGAKPLISDPSINNIPEEELEAIFRHSARHLERVLKLKSEQEG